MRYNLRISFMDAALGATNEINVEKYSGCSSCLGSGCQPGTSPQACIRCQGRGQVDAVQWFL